MLRLLCTGGGGAGTEALVRLWRGRYEVHFADADIEAIPPVVPADRRHQIPFAARRGPTRWPTSAADSRSMC